MDLTRDGQDGGAVSAALLGNGDVLVRRLDVTSRLAGSVGELSDLSEDGVLLETLVGRCVLDHDGRKVWLLLDGRRNLGEIADVIATGEGLPVNDVAEAVRAFCEQLIGLGLVEVATSADQRGHVR
jgi:hypothetical protein